MRHNSKRVTFSFLLLVLLSVFSVTVVSADVNKTESKKSSFFNLKNPLNILHPKLTEDDINQYILAYENIAKVSPLIKKEQNAVKIQREEPKCQNCDDLNLLYDLGLNSAYDIYDAFYTSLCRKCMEILIQATKEAGYKDFKAFLMMSLRIQFALYQIARLELIELIGDGYKATNTDERIKLYCANFEEKPAKETVKTRTNNNIEKTQKLCTNMRILDGFIQKLGKAISSLANKLSHKSDIELVRKHSERIYDAITDDDLVLAVRFSDSSFDD